MFEDLKQADEASVTSTQIDCLFNVGHVDVTQVALAYLEANNETHQQYLHRHERGDWGNVDQFEWIDSDLNVVRNGTMRSRYEMSGGEHLLIITFHKDGRTLAALESEGVVPRRPRFSLI